MRFTDYTNFKDYCTKNNLTTDQALKILEEEGIKKGYLKKG